MHITNCTSAHSKVLFPVLGCETAYHSVPEMAGDAKDAINGVTSSTDTIMTSRIILPHTLIFTYINRVTLQICLSRGVVL